MQSKLVLTDPALNRRDALGALGAGSLALLLPGCVRTPVSTPSPADETTLLDTPTLLETIAWRLLEHQPELATQRGVDSGHLIDLRWGLKDRSAAGRRALADTLRADLATVAALDVTPLDPATRTTVEVIRSAYRTALEGFALPYGDVAVGSWRNAPYVVIQNVGQYIDAPNLLDADHPVREASDAEAYLARLEKLPGTFDGETGRIRSAREFGLVPPAVLLDKTIAQLERTLADARTGGPLAASLTRKAASIPGDWERRATALVPGGIVPALERQLAEIKAERAVATDVPGLWSRPRGDEWYAWALRAATTTAHTPDQMHALGLEQVREYHGRMDPILRKLGYTAGTVGERMTALAKDPRYQFSEGDKGRAEVIALMEQKLDFIRGRMPLAFRRLARGNLEIRRIEPAQEAGAASAYGGAGSIDGTIPGKIWINLSDPRRHTRYSLPTLVFHEGIPGHVWQGEYSNQLPLIRSILEFGAYSEGWALYAETLGDELGAYDDDEVGRLGYLQYIALRAVRIVVDTGLHHKRWSRAQAIAWFAANTGSNPTTVTSEVDRFCGWPGQACSYKVGHSEMLRQRELAKAALGPRYDLRDFDQAVVDGGNVPLDVLAANVARYVAGARG